jgi:hypothetical protein
LTSGFVAAAFLVRLDLGGVGTISLSEIYIGATIDRLYITRKDGIKELRITMHSLFFKSKKNVLLRACFQIQIKLLAI